MSSKPNSKKPSNDNGLNLGLNKDIIKQSQSKPNKTSNLFNPFIFVIPVLLLNTQTSPGFVSVACSPFRIFSETVSVGFYLNKV